MITIILSLHLQHGGRCSESRNLGVGKNDKFYSPQVRYDRRCLAIYGTDVTQTRVSL